MKRTGLSMGNGGMRAGCKRSDFTFLERGKFFQEAVASVRSVAKAG